MVGEDALIGSASNFEQALVAFLVIVITGAVLYLIKRIIEDNSKHNTDILDLQRGFNEQFIGKMQDMVATMKEYKVDTLNEIRGYHTDSSTRLETHDNQAKCIKSLQERTLTTLEKRPCVLQNGGPKQ